MHSGDLAELFTLACVAPRTVISAIAALVAPWPASKSLAILIESHFTNTPQGMTRCRVLIGGKSLN
jgi:hypothetical protein